MPLNQIVKTLWKKACAFDKIPPDSKFVVFSDGNRAAKLYYAAVAKLFSEVRK